MATLLTQWAGKRTRDASDSGSAREKRMKPFWHGLGILKGDITGWLRGVSRSKARLSMATASDDDVDEEEEEEDTDSCANYSKKHARKPDTSIADVTENERHGNASQVELPSVKPSVIAVPTPTTSKLSRSRTGEEEGAEGMISVASALDSESMGSSTAAGASNSKVRAARWMITRSSSSRIKQPAAGSSQNRKLGPHKSPRSDPNAAEEDTEDNSLHEEGLVADYVPTCYAITLNGTRCSLFPIAGQDYCDIHSRTKPIHGTLVGEGHNGTRRDAYFVAEPGTTQCRGISARGQRCKFVSVAKWDLCCRHLLHPPSMFVPFAPGEIVEQPGESSAEAVKQGKPRVTSEAERTRGSLSEDESIIDSEDDDGDNISSGSDALDSDSEYDDISDDDEGLDSSDSEDSAWEGNKTRGRSKGKESEAKDPDNICQYISPKGDRCPYKIINTNSVCCRGHTYLEEEVKAKLAAKTDDNSSEDSSGDSSSEGSDNGEPRCYTYKEFIKMWEQVEGFTGQDTDDVETMKLVRGANQCMDPEDTVGQAKAQYGRLLPRAMKTMMKKIMQLKEDDVFLDIGHGIGNSCLQAAFTSGCEARGIEVVYSRNNIACVYRDKIFHWHEHRIKLGKKRTVGKVTLKHGQLEDDSHREFLTKGVTRAYVNNFNGVFAERSVRNNCNWFLDDYCAGLFALMVPGAIMVTLHPLNLGITQEEANLNRRKHGLEESSNASFFSVDRVLLGKACDTVKWNQHSGNEKDIYVYKYTRLEQETGAEAVFMCCNPNCEVAKKGIAIQATTINEDGRCVINQCVCKITAKNLRRQRKKRYS